MQSIVKPELPIESATEEADEDEAPVRSTPTRALARSLAEIAVMLLILIGLLNTLTADGEVSGMSMSPNLENGQRILASRIAYALFPPERGDVVLMRDPLNPSRIIIRRVVGLPGERMELRGRQVLINSQPLAEDYIGNPLAAGDNLTATSQLQLPVNQYYVLGDNRLSINDSRTWGPIVGEDILGRAWLSYWPPESIGFVPHERYELQQNDR